MAVIDGNLEPADSADSSDDEFLRIRGARVHNLRDVDVDIPRGRLVVITGPAAAAKARSPSTLFSPKDSGNMSRACHPPRGNFSIRWSGPMSMR